jgi:hypothetical protein
VTLNDFKRCCISSVLDETDDMLWKGSEEFRNVGSECEEVEGTDSAGKHSDTDW